MSTYEIRRLTTIDEMPLMQQVEEAVWQMSPIPVHQLYTTANHGGLILGAFDGDQIIAFSYGFPGFKGEKTYLCSHMLGILPDYQQAGLGEEMKYEQARHASDMGYDMMTWTFDPLQSMNAYLNLTKLGARGAHYKVNHYGAMNDRLNQGLETDRIMIEWHFNDDEPLAQPNISNLPALVDVQNNQPKARLDRFDNKKEAFTIPIPRDFHQIKTDDLDLAKQWRHATRQAFETLFKNGYEARAAVPDQANQLTYYYFTKE
ncbi:GNAT family N-acetyltransferase [Alkalibacillus almallahensis]|uniref:GNAT family N-acetyltransferase n=1 Tax=Alkalibacillus almallahensis TaxID=1379154 RepID=UPI001422EBB4|nr:GNAT family N-acetyltransferase [Alkalibacillus almallahensis]NIK13298.1 putative GNAT superfamily acetyltransferase [Alkalibacillus almallahensis]